MTAARTDTCWIICPGCAQPMHYHLALDAYLCRRCGAGMTRSFVERFIYGRQRA